MMRMSMDRDVLVCGCAICRIAAGPNRTNCRGSAIRPPAIFLAQLAATTTVRRVLVQASRWSQ